LLAAVTSARTGIRTHTAGFFADDGLGQGVRKTDGLLVISVAEMTAEAVDGEGCLGLAETVFGPRAARRTENGLVV
jgi:hypothetical protein